MSPSTSPCSLLYFIVRLLARFCRVPKLRVHVCGGDGTCSWILAAITAVYAEYRLPAGTLPVATMPLGTGNDLARALGWGGGRHALRDLVGLLEEVETAQVSLLDRWQVCMHVPPAVHACPSCLSLIHI